MLNLAVFLEDSARETPDRDAIVCGDRRLSYTTVNAVANQVANLLRARGVRPGSKVALSCPNLPYFPLVYFGALKAGAIVVPLNLLLDSDGIADQLARCDVEAFFCFEGRPDLPIGDRGFAAAQRVGSCRSFFVLPADPAADRSPISGAELFQPALAGQPTRFDTVPTQPTDTAVILFGSGTTGRAPRGAELSHLNLVLNALISDAMFERTAHDVFLGALPLFHSFGQTTLMNGGFYRRATLVLLPRFEAAAALALMERERVNLFAGVPTMYWELLTSEARGQFDIGRIGANLRHAISGGAAMPMRVLESFREEFGVEILEGYGLSETSPVASFNRPDRPLKPGSIGLPIWGVGPGEIAIRGHNVMKGYYRDPEATAQVMRDGWLRSGDIGRRDEDGYYYVIDRTVDVIVRSGRTIFPRYIEEVLMAHPGVSLVAVLGMPRAAEDAQIVAYVIRTPGATTSAAELIGWCREHLPEEACPQVVEFREHLPTTATGKILKRHLR